MPWASYRLRDWSEDLPQDATEPTVWTGLGDVVPEDGVGKRFLGFNAESVGAGGFLTRPQWANPFRSNTGLDGILYAGDDIAGPRFRLVRLLSTGAHTDITPAFWAAAATTALNATTGGSFGPGVIVNNPRFPAAYISSAGVATDMTAAVPLMTFSAVRPYKYMAVGVSDTNTAGALNTVRWTASAVPGAAPGTFLPAAGNDAGSVDLTSAGQGLPVDGGQLGEDFIIYGENAMWVMTYVGGATVMTVRRISADTGIAYRNCWAEVPGGHVVLTKDDIVLVNQTGVVKSLAHGRVRRHFFRQGLMTSSSTKQQLCQVWHERSRSRVWVCRPGVTSELKLQEAFVYELPSDSWGSATLSIRTDATDQIVSAVTASVGNTTPNAPVTFVLDQGNSLATSAIRETDTDGATYPQPTSTWTREDLDLGDASAVKVVRGFRLRAGNQTAGLTLTVTVGSKYAVGDTYVDYDTQNCVVDSTQFVPILAAGRYFRVLIKSAADGDGAVTVHGFDLEYTVRGNW